MSENNFEAGPSIVELFFSAKKLLSLQTRVENRQLRKTNSKSQQNHISGSNSEINLATAGFDSSAVASNSSASSATASSPPIKHDKVLDLLSPLSIDDLKNSPYIPKANVSTTSTNINNIKSNSTPTPSGSSSKDQNNNKNFRTINTPASINDESSPHSNMSSNLSSTSSRHNSDSSAQNTNSTISSAASSSTNIKKEHTDSFSPIVIDDDNDARYDGRVSKHPISSTKGRGETEMDVDPTRTSKPTSSTTSSSASTITSQPKSNLTSSLTSSLTQQKLKSESPTVAPSLSASTSSATSAADGKPTECFNCHTLNTPLWRKDPSGNTLCNACGLFLKLHGTTRPLSLKTDVIKKRSSRKGPSPNPKMSSSMPNSFIGSRSLNDQSLTNVIKFNSNYSNSGIPIAASVGNGNSHSNSGSANSSFNPNFTPSNNNGNFLFSNSNYANGTNTAPNSFRDNSLPRYKNVLILPKPASSTNIESSVGSAPNSTPNTPGGMNLKSIPIPNQSGTVNSPSPPYASGSSSAHNGNQQFKRKKSDLNISGDYYYNYENNNNSSGSYGSASAGLGNRRISSSTTLSNSYGNSLSNSFTKRNAGSNFMSSSFHSSSFNRRTSLTNLQSQQQRKINNNVPNGGGNLSNSLTSSNINLLNQRMTGSASGSYFDNPPAMSRHNSSSTITTAKQTIASTPGSVSASSPSYIQRNSFSNGPEYFRRNTLLEPNDGASGPPMSLNVVDLLPSSRPSVSGLSSSVGTSIRNKAFVGIDDEVVDVENLMDTSGDGDDDFFKSYTSLQNDEFVMPIRIKEDSELDLKPKTSNASTKSSLTDGLKNQKRNNIANSINNDVKDLDWLKFEI